MFIKSLKELHSPEEGEAGGGAGPETTPAETTPAEEGKEPAVEERTKPEKESEGETTPETKEKDVYTPPEVEKEPSREGEKDPAEKDPAEKAPEEFDASSIDLEFDESMTEEKATELIKFGKDQGWDDKKIHDSIQGIRAVRKGMLDEQDKAAQNRVKEEERNLRSDKEIGGENWDKSKVHINKALNHLGLSDWTASKGVAYDATFAKAMEKLGRGLIGGSIPSGGSKGLPTEKGDPRSFYPSMFKK